MKKPTHDWQAMRAEMIAQGTLATAEVPEDAPAVERAQVRGLAIQADIGIFLRRECADEGLSGTEALRSLGLIVGTAITGAFGGRDATDDHAMIVMQVANIFCEGLAVAVNSAVAQPNGGDSDFASAEVNLTQFKAQ